MSALKLDSDLRKINEARHHDPFAVLGRHVREHQVTVRVFIPDATEVMIVEGEHRLSRIPDSDFFQWQGSVEDVPDRYRLIWRDAQHREHAAHDPYSFPPQISDFDFRSAYGS